MKPEKENKNFQTLLVLYNQEIDVLKGKLLNGETWDNLKENRRNITELAVAIHKSYGYIVPDQIHENPAEQSRSDTLSNEPVN